MHERAALLGLDLVDAVEGPMHVLDQLDLGPQLAAGADAKRVRVLRHHDLGGGAEHPGRVADGHRVVARAHRGDAAAEGRGREVEHHREGPAGLEAARALEQLLLEEDPGWSEGALQVRLWRDPALERARAGPAWCP